MTRIVFHEEYIEKYHVFKDRFDAGEKLGVWLREQGVSTDIVYGIPAGGLPVAYLVAKHIGSKLDVLICRKILIPWNREAGFGAIAPDGSYFVDQGLVAYLGLTKKLVEEAIREQLVEIRRRLEKYRCGEPYTRLKGLKVLVVDDGIAAGYTMKAAIGFLEKQGVDEIIVAVPTCHPDTLARLESSRLSTIYCMNPRSPPIYAVADAYREWRDLGDEDVIGILRKARDEGLLAYNASCI